MWTFLEAVEHSVLFCGDGSEITKGMTDVMWRLSYMLDKYSTGPSLGLVGYKHGMFKLVHYNIDDSVVLHHRAPSVVLQNSCTVASVKRQRV